MLGASEWAAMKPLLALVALLMLGGCMGTVHEELWACAVKLCNTNGGVDYVWSDNDVFCKNKARFQYECRPERK